MSNFKHTRRRNSLNKAFTLVELLVVMSIIGVLATVILAGFRSSQRRSRDARRKADLKQVSSAVEMFYSDYQKYPEGSNGRIMACQYNSLTPADSGSCDWGSGKMEDGKTIYFRQLPDDPVSLDQAYYYRSAGDNDQAFQLYARIENPQDLKACIGGICESPNVPDNVVCGSYNCNFSVTSANIAPGDDDL